MILYFKAWVFLICAKKSFGLAILTDVWISGIIEYPTPPGGGLEIEMKDTEDTLRRLKSIEGHVRGIERMVDEGAYCIDVIRQIQAVQAALEKVSSITLENHLNSCLITAVRGDDPEERERVLKEISEVFAASTKT